MPIRAPLLGLSFAFVLTLAAQGQFRDPEPKAGRPAPRPEAENAPDAAEATVPATNDDGQTVKCNRGMKITALGSGFHGIVGSMAVPANIPGEQEVRKVAENLPPGGTVKYKDLDCSARQMTVSLANLPVNKPIKATVTFEVKVLPAPTVPGNALEYTAPAPKKLDAKMTVYLRPSPLIEASNSKVIQLAEEIAGDKESSWDKIRAINAWVYQKIKFEKPAEIEKLGRQNVLQTIELRKGVCAEKNSLAVALLRAAHIPARLICVTSAADYEHCYYEFYLVDGDGKGIWFCGDASASATVNPQIGSRGRIVLQKGDNVTVPAPLGRSTMKQRFVAFTLSGVPNSAGGRLSLELIAQ